MELIGLGLRVDSTGVRRGVDDLNRLGGAGSKAERGMNRFERETRQADRSVQRFGGAARAATGAVTALTSALGAREILRYSDAWNNAANQLRQVTSNTQELTRVQQALVDVAQNTRSNFESTANLYARLARSTTELNLTQEDLLSLTTTINQSFAASGATAEEASAAITQLSQGLAAGALRGDEFNSVSEQAPGIMRAIAESLNMTIGDLRAFAATGGITADIVVTALQGASDTIANDFGKTVATFGQQMEQARTNLVEWAGTSSLVQGSVNALGDAVVGVTGALSDHGGEINAIAGAAGGAALAYGGLAAATWGMHAAQVALNTAMRVNPLVAAVSAAAALSGALYTSRDATIELGDTQGTLAQWMEAAWNELVDLLKNQFGGAIGAVSDSFMALGINVGNVTSYLWETFQALMSNIAGIARATINGIIAYFETLGDSVGIILDAMRQGFRDAFGNILNIANGFWESLQAVFDGDVSFTAFKNALTAGVTEPMKAALAEIGDAAQENFGKDYLGNAIEFVGQEVESFGDRVAKSVKVMNIEFNTLDNLFLKLPKSAESAGVGIANFGDDTDETSTKTKGASAAVDSLDDSLNSLLNRLDPARQRTQVYAQTVGLLNTALAAGRISFGDYQRAMIEAQNALNDTGEETDDLKDKTEDAADEMSREWERFGNSVDDALVDMVKGADNSFDSIKDAFDTMLAELIVAAGKNEIRLRLGMQTSGPMQGGFGQLFGMGESDGLGSLVSGGRALLGMGGGASTAAAGYSAGTWAGSATGAYTGWAGSATTAASSGGIMSGIGSGISAAAPWLAGGMAIDNILGLGIVDGIVGAISGIFGGDKTDPRFQLSTAQGGPRQVADKTFENQGDNVMAEGAFGTLGFTNEGTARLKKTFDGFENAQQFLQGIAQLDDAVAALAVSPEQMQAMTERAQETLFRSVGSPEDVSQQLFDRYAAIISETDSRLSDAVSLGTDSSGFSIVNIEEGLLKAISELDADKAVEALVNTIQLERFGEAFGGAVTDDIYAELEGLNGSQINDAIGNLQSAASALSVLRDGSERLNLQFNAMAQGALNAAGAIAESVGGVENLADLQSSYYQAFFTEAERAVNLQQDITDALAEQNLQLPETREQYRALVEAQDLNTQAGRENYATLLQLAGSFDQLRNSAQGAGSAVERFRDTSLDLVDGAFKGLERSIGRERDRLRDAHDAQMELYERRIDTTSDSIRYLEGASRALENAIGAVTVESQALDQSRLRSAQAQIRGAVAAGGVPDVDALEGALGAVQTDTRQFYGTFEDYIRDQVETSQNIGKLNQRTEEQLSLEEQTLEQLRADEQREEERFERRMAGLDAQLEYYQQQINALMGIDDSVLSVAAAVRALDIVIEQAKSATSSSSGSSSASRPDYLTAKSQQLNSIGYEGRTNWTSSDVSAAFKEAGLTQQEHYEKWGKDENIPGYANGGTHQGGWRVVGERGPELEWTPPSRIMSNQASTSMMNTEAVRVAVDTMRVEMAGLLSGILSNSNELAETVDDWYRAGPIYSEGSA